MEARGWRRPKEVILSHATRDRRFVHRLARVLTDHGVAFWFSRIHLVGAQQWHDEIGAALNRCDWFILVVTPAAARSVWVKRELTRALNQSRYEERIIPLILKQCPLERLSWTLDGFQHIDFTGDFSKACRELLRVWGIKLKS